MTLTSLYNVVQLDMIDEIDVSKLRGNLSAVMNSVFLTKKRILVKKAGVPMVWLTPAEEKKSSIMDMAGWLSEKDAERIKKLVETGRNEGSKNKKYLAKW